MPQYNRNDLEIAARNQHFTRDTFEKVLRLKTILDWMNTHEFLKTHLLLKGGTAINLTVFDLPRLSVDIDMDFVPNLPREDMLQTRETISGIIKAYMDSEGYAFSPASRIHHSLDAFHFTYTNAAGNQDMIKIELNYSLRAHLFEPMTRTFATDAFGTGSTVITVHPINLLENEDEQQVFDTINTPGVSLSTAELLKNYFFRKDNVQAYENDWVAVFEKTEEQRNYWQQEIFVGRNKRPLIDLFFDSFFQIMVEDKQYGVTTEDKIAFRRVDRLSISIKEFIGNYCQGDKQKMIGKMAYYAESFAAAIHPETVKSSIPPAFGIERMNVIIFGLQTTTLIPYVLYVERNVSDVNERNAIYGILEAYIMRRIVCHASTKNYRMACSFAITA